MREGPKLRRELLREKSNRWRTQPGHSEVEARKKSKQSNSLPFFLPVSCWGSNSQTQQKPEALLMWSTQVRPVGAEQGAQRWGMGVTHRTRKAQALSGTESFDYLRERRRWRDGPLFSVYTFIFSYCCNNTGIFFSNSGEKCSSEYLCEEICGREGM